MAKFLERLLNIKFYAAEDGNGGGDPNGGEPNGGGEPKPLSEEEVQKRVSEELEKQKADIEAKVRKEIEENQHLTDQEKFAKEKEKFEQEKKDFEKQRVEQTKALNVEKIKNIYIKAGVDERLADKLVAYVGTDYESEKKVAEETVEIYKKILEDNKANILANIQKNQPTPKGSGAGDDNSNSFFDKFNERDNKKTEQKNKYFK